MLQRRFSQMLRICLALMALPLYAVDTMVVPNWMPWANDQPGQKEKGVLLDLIPELFYSVGIKPDVKILPGDRMARTIREEQTDWFFYDCASNAPSQINLGQILEVHMVVMVRKDSPLKIEPDLNGRRIAKARITLSKRLAVESIVGRIDSVDSTTDALRMLKNNHTDAVVGSFEVMTWHTRHDPLLFGDIRPISLVDGSLPICLFASYSVSAERRGWVADQIIKLRNNGRLAVLVSRYFGGSNTTSPANSR